MKEGILIMFLIYPLLVNTICLIAGLLLYFLLKNLRRKRHGKAS
jgi:hypothetical protein